MRELIASETHLGNHLLLREEVRKDLVLGAVARGSRQPSSDARATPDGHNELRHALLRNADREEVHPFPCQGEEVVLHLHVHMQHLIARHLRRSRRARHAGRVVDFSQACNKRSLQLGAAQTLSREQDADEAETL